MTTLAGTGHLLRLILRRDRVLMPLWVFWTAVIPMSYVASFKGLFPNAADRAGYALASARNSGFVALYGPLNGSSLGELVAWRAGFIPVVIGLFSILTVIRHTRTEEESGRHELVGSTVVGRHSGLAAALLATTAANVVLGALLAIGMASQGLSSAGSWAFGLEFAGAGIAFAGVGAVTAQLTSSAGSARSIAIGALGAAYMLRVVGDINGLGNGGLGWLSWVSPIGWVQRISPYGENLWWPGALAVCLALVLAAVAVGLSARRDVGAGLLPARLGPATASASLGSPLALAWRLHRGLLAGWAAGFAVLGVLFGGLAKSVGDLVGSSATMRDIMARFGGPGALIDSYLAGIGGLLGLIAAGYAIQAALRMRSEESSGRAEPVLGASVSRLHWAASHLTFSLLGPAVALAVAGVAAGLTYGITVGDVGRQVPRVLASTMVQLPAVWVLAMLTILLFGVAPRFAAVGWGGLAVSLILLLVGSTLQFNQWLLDISPFTHLPHLPGGAVTATPLVVLCLLAAALLVAGLAGLRRRDIPAS